jgi:hypothetical protein
MSNHGFFACYNSTIVNIIKIKRFLILILFGALFTFLSMTTITLGSANTYATLTCDNPVEGNNNCSVDSKEQSISVETNDASKNPKASDTSSNLVPYLISGG